MLSCPPSPPSPPPLRSIHLPLPSPPPLFWHTALHTPRSSHPHSTFTTPLTPLAHSKAGFIQDEEYERRKQELLSSSTASSTSLPTAGFIPYEEPSQTYSVGQIDRTSSLSVVQNIYEHTPEETSIRSIVESKSDRREVRLFVSSTLRDMKEERTLLVQEVFPELKEFCRQRSVAFSYVDLQWGITSEQSLGGEVIDICLDEVDKCRPYLIGVLGERYGWSSGGNIPDKLLSQSFKRAAGKRSWLKRYQDRSVTELELLYGALFYPELAKDSLFYFRDPSFVPHDSKFDSSVETSLQKEKLANLKARIRSAGFPLTENYRTPRVFAAAVLDDLKAMIERNFPKEKVKRSRIEKEIQVTNTFATDNARTHVGNEHILQNLKSHVHAVGSSPLLLLGEAGSGKTMVLSQFVFDLQDENVIVIPIFVGLFHASATRLVVSILSQLKLYFNLDKKVPTDSAEILASLNEWFAVISKRVVLVIDGADGSSDRSFTWLPQKLPSNLRVVISMATNTDVHRVLAKRGSPSVIELSPLADRDIRLLIEMELSQYGKKLSHNQTQLMVTSACSSNPLYLRTVLDQLRLHSDFDKLDAHLSVLCRLESLSGLFKHLLPSWESTCETGLVEKVLSLIAVSRRGLSEPELLALAKPDSQAAWSKFCYNLGDSIVVHGGLYTFSNSTFRDVVVERYLRDKSKKLKQRKLIVEYFKKKSLRRRKMEEYPWQLVKLDESKELLVFLTSEKLAVFTFLFQPESKVEFYKYWKATGATANPRTYFVESLASYKSRTSHRPLQYAAGLQQFAEFMQGTGYPQAAAGVIEDVVAILKNEKNPDAYEDALLRYANLLVETANFPKAEVTLQEITALQKNSGTSKGAGEVMWMRGSLKKKMGDYDEARIEYIKALTYAQNHFGGSHPETARYLKTLGDVERKLANYEPAVEYYEEALEINRLVYGGRHPSVAECLDSLGRVLKKQGLYTEAKEYYDEAMGITESIYGNEHVRYAETCLNLGDVERKLSNLDAALELYNRALRINKLALGDHPEVAETLNSIGLIFKIRGELTSAISSIEQAIKIVSKILGSDSIKLARFYNNLADCNAIQANFKQALKLYNQALQINQTVLGKDHPEVSENLNAIGKIEKKQGRYDQALKYYSDALAIVEKAFGPDHVKVAIYAHDLGVVYRKKKDSVKSMEFYQRARALNEAKFGARSAQVGMNMNGIGMLLKMNGGEGLDEAERLHSDALAIFESRYGRWHEKVALTLNLLAEVYRKKGKYEYDGAEKLYLRALDINREVFGEIHPEVAENLNGLGQVYKMQLNYPKSEEYIKKAINISITTLGGTHPHVINRYRNLADLYERAGKVELSKQTWEIVADLKKKRAAQIASFSAS